MKKKLKKIIKHSKTTTFSIVPFTNELPYFLRSADLLIAKGGGSTIAEVIATGIPTLFDYTSDTFYWERPAVKEMVKCGYGRILSNMNDLEKMIRESLTIPLEKDEMLKTNQLLFKERFLNLCSYLTEKKPFFRASPRLEQ